MLLNTFSTKRHRGAFSIQLILIAPYNVAYHVHQFLPVCMVILEIVSKVTMAKKEHDQGPTD